jgi:hypothetical protein
VEIQLYVLSVIPVMFYTWETVYGYYAIALWIVGFYFLRLGLTFWVDASDEDSYEDFIYTTVLPQLITLHLTHSSITYLLTHLLLPTSYGVARLSTVSAPYCTSSMITITAARAPRSDAPVTCSSSIRSGWGSWAC